MPVCAGVFIALFEGLFKVGIVLGISKSRHDEMVSLELDSGSMERVQGFGVIRGRGKASEL